MNLVSRNKLDHKSWGREKDWKKSRSHRDINLSKLWTALNARISLFLTWRVTGVRDRLERASSSHVLRISQPRSIPFSVTVTKDRLPNLTGYSKHGKREDDESKLISLPTFHCLYHLSSLLNPVSCPFPSTLNTSRIMNGMEATRDKTCWDSWNINFGRKHHMSRNETSRLANWVSLICPHFSWWFEQ